jgi:hypothetical protein
VCDVLNPCPNDSCDPLLGCQNVDNTDPCDDSSVCTLGDTCQAGDCVGTPIVCDNTDACDGLESCDPLLGCQPGTPPVCDDSNVCTDDSCDMALGCVFTDNTGPCDDGVACTTGDICAVGECAGTPLVCLDSDPCNGDESCDEGSGTCQSGTPLTCDDGNPCTDDACTPGVGCEFTDNTAVCDDGVNCTTGDVCGGGVCAGTAIPCLDSDLFNGDESCDEGTGTCQPGAPLDCDDGDECTIDSCTPTSGCENAVDTGNPLCLLNQLLLDVTTANPAMLGGTGRQGRLLRRLDRVRDRMQIALESLGGTRQLFRASQRALRIFQRELRRGIRRGKVDGPFADHLIAMAGQLITEVQSLRTDD